MPVSYVTVHYPAGGRHMVLRTDADWDRDVEPEVVDPVAGRHHFRIETTGATLAFKPVLRDGHDLHWAQGDNCRWFGGPDVVHVYPYFRPDAGSRVSEVFAVTARAGPRTHRFRIYTPPGYDENPLGLYPVIYLQDGPNVFFPDESFSGRDWMIDETLNALDAMQATRRAIAVAVHPNDRMVDYTRPGYAEYGRYLTEDLVPWIDSRYRTLRRPEHRLVMGSSLGGVVSLYLGWQHSDVFGNVACMSSTFGFRDDLARRIAVEPVRPVRIYLDSGWPGDNYDVTRATRDLLVRRGYREGFDLQYLAFPRAKHHEDAWAARAHIPLQFCFGPGACGSMEELMHGPRPRLAAAVA